MNEQITGICSHKTERISLNWVKNIEDYHKFKCKLRSCSVAMGNISFNDSAFVSNKDLRNFKYF